MAEHGIVYRRPKHGMTHLRDPQEELLCLDEFEVHLHPTLTKLWALRGVRPAVPAAGSGGLVSVRLRRIADDRGEAR